MPADISTTSAIVWNLCCQIFAGKWLPVEHRLLMVHQGGPAEIGSCLCPLQASLGLCGPRRYGPDDDVTRPTMRVVPIKSAVQQAVLMLHRTKDLLIRQRTMLANAFRREGARRKLDAQNPANCRRGPTTQRTSGKFNDLVAVEAVCCELVSGPKIPANREKNREFFNFEPYGRQKCPRTT